MNTIKEKIITISAKEKIKNIFLLMSSLVLSLILIGTYTENDKWIIVMIVTISLSFILMFQTLEIIGKCEKSVLKNKNFGLVLFVAGTLLSFLGTVLSSMAIGGQSLLFFNLGDVTPNACLQAIGMFIIVLNTDCEKYSKSVNNAFVFCSIGSYGVYLANVLFINIFDKILSFNVMGNAALTIVLECIAVFIICNIFIRLMSKVPVLEKFSGI